MRVLIFGANYGLLFAGMLLERGFKVDIFATKKECETINRDGFKITSGDIKKNFNFLYDFRAIYKLDDRPYNFITIAVQEPTLSIPVISDSLKYLIKKKHIIFSIMNIPLYEFLISASNITRMKNPEEVYHSIDTTKNINPDQIINCSPEPQVFSDTKFNSINIRHSGAFRCSSMHMLDHELIKKLLWIPKDSLPVYIKDYTSPWVSLSKAPMLLTGNYRCIKNKTLYSISEAVKLNITKSELIYNQVTSILKKMGAGRQHIVPFNRYLKSTNNLNAPSSVCKSIIQGNSKVERVDKLYQIIGFINGIKHNEIDKIVQDIEDNILTNNKINKN